MAINLLNFVPWRPRSERHQALTYIRVAHGWEGQIDILGPESSKMLASTNKTVHNDLN